MHWIRNLIAKLALYVVPVGQPDDGVFNPMNSAGTPLDKVWGALYEEQLDSMEAWRKNPMARRVVNLISSFVVGAGLSAETEDEQLKKYLTMWWPHPKNRMDNRLPDLCDELSRSGELFIALFPNEMDGMMYVRPKPACQIERIKWQPGDYETELAYYETPEEPGEEPREWLSPEGLRRQEQETGKLHPTAPVMLHFAINRPIGTVRGEGDLVPISDWLRRYNRWLEDRVRLNAAIRAFLWVVHAPKRAHADLREKWQKAPAPGTVIIAEEEETWEAVTPNLSARDAAADGRAIRWMITAGGPGTALTDFGEGEDSNLATAKTMGEQRRRFLLRRQAYFASMLSDLIVDAYNRSQVINRSGKMITPSDVRILRPDISTTDNELVAKALLDLIKSIYELRKSWATEKLSNATRCGCSCATRRNPLPKRSLSGCYRESYRRTPTRAATRAATRETATMSETIIAMLGETTPAQLHYEGELLSDSSRRLLRDKLRAGELDQIEFEAVTFVAAFPNSNFYRFRDEDLAAFAASYSGQPFLRNHDTHDIASRDGTIASGKLFNGNEFRMKVALTTARGMQAFVEGQIDRFSIGWYYSDITCTVCGHDWLDWQHCSHWPGRSYSVKDDAGKTQDILCEIIFEDPRGKETSAVNAPAVEGTGLLAQLTEIKEQKAKSEPSAPPMEEATMPPINAVEPEATLEETAPAAVLEDTAPPPAAPQGSQETPGAWDAYMRKLATDTALSHSGLRASAQNAIRNSLTARGGVRPRRRGAGHRRPTRGPGRRGGARRDPRHRADQRRHDEHRP